MERVTSYASPPTNAAVAKLRSLDGGLRELADQVGNCSAASLSDWRREKKKPSRGMRERLALAFGIAPDDWERAPDAAPELPTAADVEAAGLEPGQVEQLDNLQGALQLLREIRAAAQESDVTATTRERLAAREIVLRKFIESVTASARFEADRIVRYHNSWPGVRAAITQAVAPCAECSARVVSALREIE